MIYEHITETVKVTVQLQSDSYDKVEGCFLRSARVGCYGNLQINITDSHTSSCVVGMSSSNGILHPQYPSTTRK